MSFSIFCLGNQISQITFEKCYQRYRVTNSKRGPHFIYCIGQTGSVKERVCNDDHKDSRRVRDKPMVNMRAECCSANLQLAPQWQFHACRTGLQAGRRGVAQSQPWLQLVQHTQHAHQGLVCPVCLLCFTLLSHCTHTQAASPFLSPTFTAGTLFHLTLSYLLHSSHSPSRFSVTLQKLSIPPGKSLLAIPFSSSPHHPHQYPMFSPSSRGLGYFPVLP